MTFDRVQRALLIFGLFLAAFLLVRFAIDFSAEMPFFLTVPFGLLVLLALTILIFNLLRVGQTTDRRMERVLLLAAIPLGFLASSLDCSGLSPQGCTPFCTFIKIVWIPLLAVVSTAYFFLKSPWVLTLLTAMLFVPLVPHCICYNVGNGWWIARLGASPTCYVWGFVAGLICLSALKSRSAGWVSLVLCGTILSGAFGFFIAHHYFHFPW